MKQRLEATHFIDVAKHPEYYKGNCYSHLPLDNSKVYKITSLNSFFDFNKQLGFKTIAVWKIKYK